MPVEHTCIAVRSWRGWNTFCNRVVSDPGLCHRHLIHVRNCINFTSSNVEARPSTRADVLVRVVFNHL